MIQKIAIAGPVHLNAQTHAAGMVLSELVLMLAEKAPELEIRLITPHNLKLGLAGRIAVRVEEPRGTWGSLLFEQRELPRLAASLDVEVLLMPYASGPLASLVPVVVLDAINTAVSRPGLGARVLGAVRAAGVEGASIRNSFSDVHQGRRPKARIKPLEPWVHTGFRALSMPEDRETASGYDLPYHFVLAHGIPMAEIPAVLAAWTWVDGSVGDTVPLAVPVSSETERQAWVREIQRMGVEHSVRLVERVTFDELPALYRRAEAMLLGGSDIQHQVLRWAMATGLPVAAFDSAIANQVLGSAGYLVTPGDTRALGAACLTVIVEPDLRDELRKAGLMQASSFHRSSAPETLVHRLAQAAAH